MNIKYIHKHNAIFNTIVTKLVTKTLKHFFHLKGLVQRNRSNLNAYAECGHYLLRITLE